MNPHLLNAKTEFWHSYSAVRQSLKKLPWHQLEDLQHEADDLRRQMSIPFSERAAAELVHTACTELLS